MPFIRKGLCATDQRKCARMLDNGAKPSEVAKTLKTTVEYVKKFTTEAIAEQAKKVKKAEKAAVKHAADTRKTAAALAGAAKEILTESPEFS